MFKCFQSDLKKRRKKMLEQDKIIVKLVDYVLNLKRFDHYVMLFAKVTFFNQKLFYICLI